MSDVKALASAYLCALNAGNLDAVLKLFTDDAIVRSPLYGVQPAASFYAKLFADTQRSQTRLHAVLVDVDNSDAAAFHFSYEWTLATGAVASFVAVDLVTLSRDRSRFTGLTIVYDTAPLRADFAAI